MSARAEFVAKLEAVQVPEDVARAIIRHAATHQRLGVAACNGDFPCDNGVREVAPCTRCQCLYAPGVLVRGLCPSCRAEDRIRGLCAPYGITPDFSGDPRGHTVKLAVPGVRGDDWGGTGLLCVP